MLELEKNMQNLKTIDEQSNLPYKHCLNCGAELKGVYCHCCGQEAVDKTPTIRGFVMTYIDNAFLWDSQFLKTFWGANSSSGASNKRISCWKVHFARTSS